MDQDKETFELKRKVETTAESIVTKVKMVNDVELLQAIAQHLDSTLHIIKNRHLYTAKENHAKHNRTAQTY